MDVVRDLLVPPASGQAESPRGNRGWFRSGDPRINRRGRPTRIGAMARRASAGEPLSGPLMRLFVSESDLLRHLGNWKAATPLRLADPREFRIVAAEYDPKRGGVILTLHSHRFAVVEPGLPIPEMPPAGSGEWVRLFRS